MTARWRQDTSKLVSCWLKIHNVSVCLFLTVCLLAGCLHLAVGEYTLTVCIHTKLRKFESSKIDVSDTAYHIRTTKRIHCRDARLERPMTQRSFFDSERVTHIVTAVWSSFSEPPAEKTKPTPSDPKGVAQTKKTKQIKY